MVDEEIVRPFIGDIYQLLPAPPLPPFLSGVGYLN